MSSPTTATRPNTALSAALSISAAILSLSPHASAQHAALPADLIALDTPEGEKLFVEANARADYFRLSEYYVTQQAPSTCGVASAVMALNALGVPAPKVERWGARTFTEDVFFNDCARRVHPPEAVSHGGATLEQLADLLRCHPAKVDAVHASATTLDDFRKVANNNLSDPSNFIVINYLRSELGQEYSGHFSPLAAYNAQADRFLLMDVARYKYPPVWAKADALFNAMNTSDPVSSQSRGYLLISPAVTPPGPSGASKARNPLHMLAGIVGGAFVFGAALGAGVTGLVARRRARKKAATAGSA